MLCHKNYNFKQEDLTFLLQVYHDFELAKVCVNNLRTHYPNSRLVIISDGDPDPRIKQLASDRHGEYIAGEWLYGIESGGKMIQRMLSTFLSSPSQYLLKIDSDTTISRPFGYFPGKDCIFGTRQRSKLTFSIQGGFVGFTLNSAKKLLNSNIFLSNELSNYKETWAKNNKDLILAVKETKRIRFEWVLAFAAKKLSIPQLDFKEVCSKWKHPVRNTNLRYAATHPNK